MITAILIFNNRRPFTTSVMSFDKNGLRDSIDYYCTLAEILNKNDVVQEVILYKDKKNIKHFKLMEDGGWQECKKSYEQTIN